MAIVKLTCTLHTAGEIHGMIAGLCMAALSQLRVNRLPPLYQAGVRYKAEPPGQERWLLPLQVKRLGYGDCEDLVAWRVAELRLRGEHALPALQTVRPGLMHVLVRRANGALDDPSRVLGMGK